MRYWRILLLVLISSPVTGWSQTQPALKPASATSRPTSRPAGEGDRVLVPIRLHVPDSVKRQLNWGNADVTAVLQLWEKTGGDIGHSHETPDAKGENIKTLQTERSVGVSVKQSGVCIVRIRPNSIDEKEWLLKIEIHQTGDFPFKGKLEIKLSSQTLSVLAKEGARINLDEVVRQHQKFQVLKDDGKPLSNAQVRILQEVRSGRRDVVQRILTNDLGQFELDLWSDIVADLEVDPGNSNSLRYARTQLNTDTLRLAQETWKLNPIEVGLTGLVRVEGVELPSKYRLWYRTLVKDRDKDPERAFMLDNTSYIEVENGNFCLYGLAKGETYEFLLDDSMQSKFSIKSGGVFRYEGKKITEHALELKPIATRKVELNLRSNTGQPIVGGSIVSRILKSKQLSDSSGRAVLECAEIDEIIVDGDGYGTTRTSIEKTSPTSLTVVLQKLHQMQLAILDSNNKPLQGARVFLAQFVIQPGREFTGLTDTNGNVVVSGLAEGLTQISVKSDPLSTIFVGEVTLRPKLIAKINAQQTGKCELRIELGADIRSKYETIVVVQKSTGLVTQRLAMPEKSQQVALPLGQYVMYAHGSGDSGFLYSLGQFDLQESSSKEPIVVQVTQLSTRLPAESLYRRNP